MRDYLKSRTNVFEPEVIDLVVKVFDEALAEVLSSRERLGFTGTVEEARGILAKEIVAMAAAGERNPTRLREDAIARLAKVFLPD